MCFYKILKNDETGYVTQCNKCKHMHVAFGNTILTFTEDQFSEFSSMVWDYYEQYKGETFRDTKIVQISTIAKPIILVYTVNELEKFCYLLKDAEKRLKHEKLFVFNNN